MSKTEEFTAIIICESKATVSSGFPFSADYISSYVVFGRKPEISPPVT